MKVLHIITGLNDGGAEAVLYRLCINGRTNSHVVVSMMDGGKYGPLLEEAGIEVHCLGMRAGRITFFGVLRLWLLIRGKNPDIVQTWMYHSDLIGGLAARAAGTRRVFWGIHHSTLDKGKAKNSTIWIARICAFLSNRIPEKIICCAQKALTVHAEQGYVENKLVVIPNGYDLSLFKPNISRGQAVREELGVDENIFLIGNVGRFHPFKDHNNLLRALALLNNADINFRCLLVGKGLTTGNKPLMNLINELELQKMIILAGQRPDVSAIMNSLDLHVLSSSSEGFPNVLAEAMACGTPCVTTQVGDALDIVGDAQLTCPPQDHVALSQLIQKMHQQWRESPQAWADHRKTCIQRIEQRFAIQTMVEAYDNCWSARK